MANMHSFDVEVAQEVGVNAAILLQSIKWWCLKNKANDRHYHDGLYWTYNSTKALAELYPYLGKGAIGTALRKLEDGGYIRTGNFNKSAYDRTKWYAITAKGFALFGESIYQIQEMDLPESANPNGETSQPIPVTNQLQTKSNTGTQGQTTRRTQAFKPPTVDEVASYCQQRGNGIDAQHFIDYYAARGWQYKGGTRMKDWKAAVRTWERNNGGADAKPQQQGGFDAARYNYF